jgi:6,7-dimethyl-8-ribityllumazine synthase
MNTFKVVERVNPEYEEDTDGYVIVEVTIQGQVQHFKIPTSTNSDGVVTYDFYKTHPVFQTQKTVSIWE